MASSVLLLLSLCLAVSLSSVSGQSSTASPETQVNRIISTTETIWNNVQARNDLLQVLMIFENAVDDEVACFKKAAGGFDASTLALVQQLESVFASYFNNSGNDMPHTFHALYAIVNNATLMQAMTSDQTFMQAVQQALTCYAATMVTAEPYVCQYVKDVAALFPNDTQSTTGPTPTSPSVSPLLHAFFRRMMH